MRDNVGEGAAALLRDHLQSALANDFNYYRIGCDAFLGVAMALEGDFAGGVRFLEAAIQRNEHEGGLPNRDFVGIVLAETYLEFLAPRHKPPAMVVLKNLIARLKRALMRGGCPGCRAVNSRS